MRILLIAYEFPPSPSPQSLRWAYLTRELAALGHEVHVLTPDIGPSTDSWPLLPQTVRIHRTFAGPFRGLLAARQAQKLRGHAPGESIASPFIDAAPTAVNWKYRLVQVAQRVLARWLFPDERGEWRPWARRRLDRLLQELSPAVVIASHEPATSLELGLMARRQGFPLIADLGDPVLAPYTPPRWHGKSSALERQVCEQADRVIVTTHSAQQLLTQRHGSGRRIRILTQGYDDSMEVASIELPNIFEPARLELLYTGNFYRFRRPDALIDALRGFGGIRLNVATPAAPASLLQACRDSPHQFRLLGLLPHARVLSLQRQADVLVHIANDQPMQIPGKLFEYLGAGRPILYLGNRDQATADLLAKANAGWVVDNAVERIREALRMLLALKRGAGLPVVTPVTDFGWSRIGAQLHALLEEVATGTSAGAGSAGR